MEVKHLNKKTTIQMFDQILVGDDEIIKWRPGEMRGLVGMGVQDPHPARVLENTSGPGDKSLARA